MLFLQDRRVVRLFLLLAQCLCILEAFSSQGNHPDITQEITESGRTFSFSFWVPSLHHPSGTLSIVGLGSPWPSGCAETFSTLQWFHTEPPSLNQQTLALISTPGEADFDNKGDEHSVIDSWLMGSEKGGRGWYLYGHHSAQCLAASFIQNLAFLW